MAQSGAVRPESRVPVNERREVPHAITTGSPIRALAFTADGRYLVSGDKEAVRVWQLTSNWQWQQTGWAEAKDVRCIAVSKDRRWIAAGKSWGETTVWDRRKTTTVSGSDSVPALDKPVFTDNDGHTVTSVDFSPIDPTRLVIASGSRTASIWDIANNKRLIGPLEHSYWVVAAKFSPDGRYIATATYHRDSVRLYNSDDGSMLAEFPANVTAYYNTGLLWSNVSDSIFVLSKNATNTTTIKEFRFRNLSASRSTKTTAPDSEWPVSESNCPCIASPHPGKFIVYSACGGVKVLVTSSRNNTQEETLFEPSLDVLSMAISPDGRLLATGDWDGKDGVGSITFKSVA